MVPFVQMNSPNFQILKLQEFVSRDVGRKILLIIKKKKCCKCGSEYNVEAHHKDRNTKNNKAENLEFRCGPCHIKYHKELKKLRLFIKYNGKKTRVVWNSRAELFK